VVTKGITHLEVSVKRRETEKTTEDLVNVGGKDRWRASRGLSRQCLSDTIQRGIHVTGEVIHQEPIRRSSQEEKCHGEKAAVPEGEACPDGSDAHDHSAFNT
jgi:hypothetical protein